MLHPKSKVMETLDQNSPRPRKYRVNGITYYNRMGKLCQMSSTRETVKIPPTEKQIESREALHVSVSFANNFFMVCDALVPAWDLLGLLLQKERMAAFKKVNFPVFDPVTLGVDYFPDFIFCVGDLVPPRKVEVRRDGWTLFIDWTIPAREYGLSRPDDKLIVGYFYASRPAAPHLLTRISFTRDECHAEVKIPARKFPVTEGLHVYIMFRSHDWSAYSNSRYGGLVYGA